YQCRDDADRPGDAVRFLLRVLPLRVLPRGVNLRQIRRVVAHGYVPRQVLGMNAVFPPGTADQECDSEQRAGDKVEIPPHGTASGCSCAKTTTQNRVAQCFEGGLLPGGWCSCVMVLRSRIAGSGPAMT